MRISKSQFTPSLAFLCLFSGLWTSAFAGVPENSALVFEEGFESGVYAHKNSGNAPEVVKVLDARAGSYVLKSQLTASRENKYRTETTLNEKGLKFEVGKEYWVGMSIKLGDDFKDKSKFDDQGMLTQWHYFDWLHPEVRDAQPLLVRFQKDKVRVHNEVLEEYMKTVKPAYGEWVDWVFRVKFDDQDGIIQIWRNGEQIVDFAGDNHQVEKHTGAYLKFGLYSSQYRRKPLQGEDTRTVYHDEIRIAGADGSYELVAPRGDR
jgi:hypothetical protein